MIAIRVNVRGRWFTVEVGDLSSSPVKVTVEGETFEVELEGSHDQGVPAARRRRARGTAGITAGATATTIDAPMPGRIVRVSVDEGQTVASGEEVCVLETMKMEQSIRAPQAGVVKAVKVQPGQSVGGSEVLVELE